MRANKRKASFTTYYWIIGICSVLLILLSIIKTNPVWVENYYSKGFYPVWTYLYVVLFSWIPFSFGDLFYGVLMFFLVLFLFRLIQSVFKRHRNNFIKYLLQLVLFILLIYSLFYINWGLNYYRVPLAEQIHLDIDNIKKEDHLKVLEEYISEANLLRERLDFDQINKRGVRGDLQEFMREDTLFNTILSQSQIKVKEPISSPLISHFTVSGYFNPFTMEVQVNQEIPKASYPFVNIHELAHQMGIGFEDECNFIAFRKLMYHKSDWYRYSAYYSAIQYLLQPIYADKVLLEKYKAKLSPQVKADLQEEYEFWKSYRGWIDHVSSIFYNQYLKHNNQPEGLERYNMMTKLIVAWEKQQQASN